MMNLQGIPMHALGREAHRPGVRRSGRPGTLVDSAPEGFLSQNGDSV